MKKDKRITRLTLGLVKSIYTGIVYVVLFEDSEPIKLWQYDLLNETGISIITELIKGFDLGYNIEFQFPQIVKGERKIVPIEMVLVGEPGGKEVNIFNKKNAIPKESFSINNTQEELPDENMMNFLQNYEKEKGLI